MKFIIIKSLLAAALLLPFAAGAAPITGDIGITGSLLPTCTPEGLDCDMAVADGLDFIGDRGIVVFATGDFAGLAPDSEGVTIVTMNDFTFDPFEGVDPLWSVGGFNFALETLTIVSQTSTSLELRGNGTISFDDPTRSGALDPTMGSWSFSSDIASGASTFAWSSTTLAPEPGILLLIGMGLIGGLGARRLTRS